MSVKNLACFRLSVNGNCPVLTVLFFFFFFSVDHREPLKVLEERNDLKIGGGQWGLGVPGEIPGECELGFTC